MGDAGFWGCARDLGCCDRSLERLGAGVMLQASVSLVGILDSVLWIGSDQGYG